MESGARASVVDDLWFRRRPALAVAVAGAMFAAVFVLRLASGGPTEAYSMLFALPVALLAVGFGARGGVAAGVTAVFLTVVWAGVQGINLAPLAWASRVVPLLLLGLLLGHASDRARHAEQQRREFEAAALLHRQAIEINDSVVQHLAAARWALEQRRLDDGLALLDETMSKAQGMVSELIRRADMGSSTEADVGSRPAGISPSRTGVT